MAEAEEKDKKKVLKYGRKFSSRRVLIISTGGTFNCVETDIGLQPQFNESNIWKFI